MNNGTFQTLRYEVAYHHKCTLLVRRIARLLNVDMVEFRSQFEEWQGSVPLGYLEALETCLHRALNGAPMIWDEKDKRKRAVTDKQPEVKPCPFCGKRTAREPSVVTIRFVTPHNIQALTVHNPPYGSVPRQGDVVSFRVGQPKYRVVGVEYVYDHNPGHSLLVGITITAEPVQERR